MVMRSGLARARRLFRQGTVAEWRFGALTVHGDRSMMTARRRALLLSDSYGPTLQINFLRPLSRLGGGEAWGMLALTEAAAASNGETAASDLDRLLGEFRPDVIVASRYAGTMTARLVERAAAARIPLIAHIDDNLFEVPRGLGSPPSRHDDLERRARLAQLLRAADLNYVSTAALREKLQGLGVLAQRVFVADIAGAAAPMREIRADRSLAPVFGYMGSRSHAGDLELVAPAIAMALRRFPKARFELFGSIERPAALAEFPIRHHAKVRDYTAFLRTLGRLRWSFALAPLIVDDFTLMKTNVKWIEYTAAAMPVIASDHPVYAECCSGGAGLLVAPEDWLSAIERMMQAPDLRESMTRAAMLRLESSYTLERLRQQVLTAFATAGVPQSNLA